jgi:hypothetical protein
MAKTKPMASITERALVQRIRRKLKADGEALLAARGVARQELGDYYVVNLNTNCIVTKDCDLEELGRETGTLRPWETLAKEEAK